MENQAHNNGSALNVENSDVTAAYSLFTGNFRSSDLYFKLKPGKCYIISYYGVRAGIASMYKNIYDAELINKSG